MDELGAGCMVGFSEGEAGPLSDSFFAEPPDPDLPSLPVSALPVPRHRAEARPGGALAQGPGERAHGA